MGILDHWHKIIERIGIVVLELATSRRYIKRERKLRPRKSSQEFILMKKQKKTKKDFKQHLLSKYD